jgi:hypothetical protein
MNEYGTFLKIDLNFDLFLFFNIFKVIPNNHFDQHKEHPINRSMQKGIININHGKMLQKPLINNLLYISSNTLIGIKHHHPHPPPPMNLRRNPLLLHQLIEVIGEDDFLNDTWVAAIVQV